MTWVAWRQFRTQALVALGLLAVLAAVVLVTGMHLRDVYNSLGAPGCHASNGDCSALTSHDRVLASLLGPVLVAIPALLGIFWGAPLLARELESGTYRLAWTQSVTRRRWLSTKVALVGLFAVAVAGVGSWLVSWWFVPLDAVSSNRLDPSVFTARGVVAIGYAAFAVALGIAIGAFARRTLPTMAATLLGFVATRVAFTLWVRPHLLPTREVLVPVTAGKGVGFESSASGLTIAAGAPPIPNTWAVSDSLVDRAHHVLSAAQLHDLLMRTCPAVTAGLQQKGGVGDGTVARCQVALSHHVQQLVALQPSSHYWPLQALETAIFMAAALALIAVTVWRVGHHARRKTAVGEPREQTTHASVLEIARPRS